MLSKILHSLLLLPVSYVQTLLFHLLAVLEPLDCLNRLLPEGVQSEQESNSSSGEQMKEIKLVSVYVDFSYSLLLLLLLSLSLLLVIFLKYSK